MGEVGCEPFISHPDPFCSCPRAKLIVRDGGLPSRAKLMVRDGGLLLRRAGEASDGGMAYSEAGAEPFTLYANSFLRAKLIARSFLCAKLIVRSVLRANEAPRDGARDALLLPARDDDLLPCGLASADVEGDAGAESFTPGSLSFLRAKLMARCASDACFAFNIDADLALRKPGQTFCNAGSKCSSIVSEPTLNLIELLGDVRSELAGERSETELLQLKRPEVPGPR
mmetsp:Transcript_38438/g.87305  ORF Transcript_38438/g.87305 Transcript_38438/m.87305 type:complete len:227 (+) Transcript_38438:2624-3304(+)